MDYQFIDIHSHIGVKNSHILSHPTLSLADDAIFSSEELFWCALHPWDSALMKCDEIVHRLDIVKDKMIGIGEMGLDYAVPNLNVSCQKIVFECQLDYALSNNFPITIHCVKAYNDIVQILKSKSARRVIIHSFASHPVVALQLLDLGCYISFSEMSLRSKKCVDALRQIPLERLFLETDGEKGRNKGKIEDIYAAASDIRGISINDLKKQIYNNYLCLIG